MSWGAPRESPHTELPLEAQGPTSGVQDRKSLAQQGHRAGPFPFGPAYLYVGFAFPESSAAGWGVGGRAGEVGLKEEAVSETV